MTSIITLTLTILNTLGLIIIFAMLVDTGNAVWEVLTKINLEILRKRDENRRTS